MSSCYEKVTFLKGAFLILFILSKVAFLFSQGTTSAIADFDFYIARWEVQNEKLMDDGSWLNPVNSFEFSVLYTDDLQNPDVTR